jgi:hypothetical protein
MDGNMTKEEKQLWLITKIKDPKVRAGLRRDFLKLMHLKKERDKQEEIDKQNKIRKYHDKYRSTKLH